MELDNKDLSEYKFYLQYMSDIHLEFWKNKYPKFEPVFPGKTYLALLGDIGYPHSKNYEDFLNHHSKIFEKILIISGNHEYYTSKTKQYTMDDIENKINEICSRYNNIYYLQKSSLNIGNTLFLGCTLWTNISLSKECKSFMNDYSNIYISNKDRSYGRTFNTYIDKNSLYGRKKKHIQPYKDELEILHISEKHLDMKSWLFKEIEDNKDKNIIILTHHPPSFKMLDEHNLIDSNGLLKYFYASDLDEDISKLYNVDHWLCGHTHLNKEISIGYILCQSNCVGRKFESIKTFNPNKCIGFN